MLGSPKTDNMYHAGWAWAGSTPYKGTKLLASHFGGTRNPMAVRWPAKIKPDPTPRAQFHHVNDIAPTLYEILGITPPRVVNGIPQDPIDGVSFAYTFDDAKAKGASARSTSRSWAAAPSITTAGWRPPSARARRGFPGLPKGIREWTPDKDKWELYNLDEDWSQANDLADKMPQKLADMKDVFLIEFAKNQGLSHRRRSLGSRPAPGAAEGDALHRMDLPRRNHAHAGVLRTGARQQAERRHDRRRDSGKGQRRAVRAGRLLRRPQPVREGRHALLRVQPVRASAHPHPRQGEACPPARPRSKSRRPTSNASRPARSRSSSR